MRLAKNPLSLFLAGAIIVLALINLVAIFAIFDEPPTPTPTTEDTTIAPEEADDSVQGELIEDVGGLTSPTGIASLVTSVILIGLSIGLAFDRPWEFGLMFFLGADATFKLVNLISQLAIGKPLSDVLPSALLFALDAALIAGLFQHWRWRRTQPDAPVEVQHNPPSERSTVR